MKVLKAFQFVCKFSVVQKVKMKKCGKFDLNPRKDVSFTFQDTTETEHVRLSPKKIFQPRLPKLLALCA